MCDHNLRRGGLLLDVEWIFLDQTHWVASVVRQNSSISFNYNNTGLQTDFVRFLAPSSTCKKKEKTLNNNLKMNI